MQVTHPQIQDLLIHYKDISQLNRIKAILDWDLNVTMPPKASAGRAEQTGYLAQLITEKWHDTTFRKNLEKANTLKGKLSEEEQAILRNLNHAGKFYFSVPKALIIEREKVTAASFVVWREAREANDFKKFQPHLEQIISLNQQIAQHLGAKENLYDALLDQFEPELTAAYCQQTFTAIRPALVELVKKIQQSKNQVDEKVFLGEGKKYPKPEQERLATFIMKKMGYDFAAGRMDVSAHPFTTQLGREDVRLTTRYNDADFRESFTACMHETGHALYEQGVSREYDLTPLEGGVSLGIHETVSRFWENMVGKNVSFLSFCTPLFQAAYPKQLGDVSSEQLALAFNTVKPSFIRIEADEVTYSLHIILRFEMENELLNNKMRLADAPEVWREKSKEYFGIAPSTDSEGILQDVHWTYGAFGYFPAYALGNLYGAQLLHSMKKNLVFDAELATGNLHLIRKWLQQHIHQYGSLYFPSELIQKATGEPLNPQYFIEYLKEKYNKLYNL